MAINERLIHTASDATDESGNQQEGLILHLDANDVDSYDGDGSVWYDITNHEYTPAVNPAEHFNTVTYSGAASAQSITGVGFQPDMVWIKSRNLSNNHVLIDSVRGLNGGSTYENVYPNLSNAQANDNAVNSLDSDGFSLANTQQNANHSSYTYVAWCFKAGGAPTASTPFMVDGTGYATMSAAGFTDGTESLDSLSVNNKLGFSIAKWSGSTALTGDTVAHGLGETPELIIHKSTSLARDWNVYSKGVGLSKNLHLNQSHEARSNEYWTVNANTFSIHDTSTSGDWIAYSFTSKRGVSKVGSYTGTGAAGNKVYTGFQPAWVMMKRTNASGNAWLIVDNKRKKTSNGNAHELFANTTTAESGSGYDIDFNGDGFTLNTLTTNANANGGTYIYLALARNSNAADLTPSTDGTEIEKDLAVDSTKVYYSDSNYAIEQDSTVWRGNADNTGGTHEGEAYINNYFESGDTGKFYFEVESLGHTHGGVGFTDPTKYTASSGQGNTSFRNSQFYGLGANSYKYLGSTGSNFSTTIGTAGVILAVAIDVATRKVWMGTVSSGTITWYSSGNPSIDANPFFTLPSSFSFYQPLLTDLSYSSAARTGWHKLLREQTASSLPTGFTYMKGAIKNADLELNIGMVYNANPTTSSLTTGSIINLQADEYESSDGSTWNNQGTHATNSTITGATHITKFGTSFFRLDGTNDFIDTSIDDAQNLAWTIEIWFRAANTGNNENLLSSITGSGSYNGFSISINTDGKLSAAFLQDEYQVFTGPVIDKKVDDGKWHHLIMSWDGVSGSTLYRRLDNVAYNKTTTRAGTTSSDTNLRIGKPALNYYGEVDVAEMRLYSSNLTESQMTDNYNARKELYELAFDDKLGNHDLTLEGTSLVLQNEELGDYFDFNGTTDFAHITATATTPLDFSAKGYTLEAWINQDDTDYNYVMAKYGTSDALRSFIFGMWNDGKVALFERGTGISNTLKSTSTIPTNKWTHIAVVRSSSNAKFYINGELDNTVSSTFTNGNGGTQRITVGKHESTTPAFFNGKIGQVRAYDTELTADQVMQNYRFTKNDYPNGFNGTISGATWNVGGYFDFDGTDDQVSFTASNLPSTGFSISAWFNMDNLPASGYAYGVVAWGDEAIGERRSILVWNGGSGNPHAYFSGYGSSANIGGTTELSAGYWYHVVVTEEGGTAKVYLNGSEDGSGSVTLNAFTGTTGRVGNTGAINEDFDGKISDVKIFDKVLTTEEVTAEYNKGQFGNN